MRCKNCREVFTKKYFIQPTCMEKPECIKWFNEWVKKKTEEKKKKEDRDWVKRVKPETHSKEYKKALQDAVNKLSKMVDAKFGYNTCIDCGGGFGAQTDACHYHSKGAHLNLSYNLHNLHSGNSQHNQFSDTHKQGYEKGLKSRYGEEYFEMVNALGLKYPKIKLSNVEVVEKLEIVRKLIRTFDTFIFTDAAQARTQLNKIINIYQ